MKTPKISITILVAAVLFAVGGYAFQSAWPTLGRRLEARGKQPPPSLDENPERYFGLNSAASWNRAEARKIDPQELLDYARAHPDRPEFLWLYFRTLLSRSHHRVNSFKQYGESPQPVGQDLQRDLRARSEMIETLRALDPDNGWTYLAAGLPEIYDGITQYTATLSEADPSDGRTDSTILVATAPEHSAAAARLLHKAVRRPVFTQYNDVLTANWRRGQGDPQTMAQGMDIMMPLFGVALPHLSSLREYGRAMAAEAERRAPPLKPRPWKTVSPADDPQPPRPSPGDVTSATARAWSNWRKRMVSRGRGPLPPPLPGPPPAGDDGLGAYDILRDVQTLGARSIAEGGDRTMIGILTGWAVLRHATEEGRRILIDAGQPDEAERLTRRGRRLLRPWLLVGLSGQLYDARATDRDPEPRRARRIAENPLYRDAGLWAEAEAMVSQPLPPGADPWERLDTEIAQHRIGILAHMITPHLGRSTPVNAIPYRAGSFNATRRMEYYGIFRELLLPTAAKGLWLFLAGATLVAAIGDRSRRSPRLDRWIAALLAAAAIATPIAMLRRIVVYLDGLGSYGKSSAVICLVLMLAWSLSVLWCFRAYVASRRDAAPGDALPATTPRPARGLLAGLAFAGAAWLLPALLIEAPGMPTHAFSIPILVHYYDLFVEHMPPGIVTQTIGAPLNIWLFYWYAWGFAAGLWALLSLAGPAKTTEPAIRWRRIAALLFGGGRRFPWALAGSAAIFSLTWIMNAREEPPLTLFGNVTATICLAAASLLLAETLAAGLLRLGRALAGRDAGTRWTLLAGIACGVALWLGVANVWAYRQDRYWTARESMLLSRVGDEAVVLTRLEDAFVDYFRRAAPRPIDPDDD